jgi:excisionase family DNA binding protein
MPYKEWLTVRDIAVLLRVRESTVRHWIRKERLGAKFLGGRAGYRVKDENLEKFLNQEPVEGDSPGSTNQLTRTDKLGLKGAGA